MKKIILICIILILIFAIYSIVANGIDSLSILAFEGIKKENKELEDTIAKATNLADKEYVAAKSDLDKSIESLMQEKEDYEKLLQNNETTQINNYKIEYLWTNLGQYANKNSVELSLDVNKNKLNNSYSLSFTLIGEYLDIADFLYELEENDELSFKVEDFKVEQYTQTRVIELLMPEVYEDTKGNAGSYKETDYPYDIVESMSTVTYGEENKKSDNKVSGEATTTSKLQTVVSDPDKIIATFTVQNINIELN